MKTATFSELRNNAKKYFDLVEHGESVEIFRHGKPVAVIAPYRSGGHRTRRNAVPLQLSGVSLSETILAERRLMKL